MVEASLPCFEVPPILFRPVAAGVEEDLRVPRLLALAALVELVAGHRVSMEVPEEVRLSEMADRELLQVPAVLVVRPALPVPMVPQVLQMREEMEGQQVREEQAAPAQEGAGRQARLVFPAAAAAAAVLTAAAAARTAIRMPIPFLPAAAAAAAAEVLS